MNKTKLFLSFLSGLFLFLSFPDANFYYLAWVCFVPLLIAVKNENPLNTLVYGVIAGFTAYTGIIYWIFPMMRSNTDPQRAFLTLAALSLYLASYIVLWAAGAVYANKYLAGRKMKEYSLLWVLFCSALWVALEYARTVLFTGFSWALLGLSQWKFINLIQIAEYTGTYGVSFVLIFSNCLIAKSLFERRVLPLAGLAVLIFFLCFSGRSLARTNAPGAQKQIRVCVLQPNIDQYKKFDDAFVNEIRNTFARMTAEASANKPDVIIWPETAVPENLPPRVAVSQWEIEAVKRSGTFNIIGVEYMENEKDYYNATVLVGPEGGVRAMHKKLHLIPIGEYIPLRPLLASFFGTVNMVGDVREGNDYNIFQVNGAKIGAVICSENFSGGIIRKFAAGGAGIIVIQSNTAWAYMSSAPWQHFIMNVFRAVENRRDIVVCSNAGVSGLVGRNGIVVKSTKIFTQALLCTEADLYGEITFYTKWGDIFAYTCVLFVFLSFGIAFRMKPKLAA